MGIDSHRGGNYYHRGGSYSHRGGNHYHRTTAVVIITTAVVITAVVIRLKRISFTTKKSYYVKKKIACPIWATVEMSSCVGAYIPQSQPFHDSQQWYTESIPAGNYQRAVQGYLSLIFLRFNHQTFIHA